MTDQGLDDKELSPGELALAVLACPMGNNDSGENTIGGYLIALLMELYREGEGFSGKRPFGNSGWESDLYLALVRERLLPGKLDSDGYLEEVDPHAGDRLIMSAIRAMLPVVSASSVVDLSGKRP